jgi:ABC-2 type transport system permease protein
MMAQVRMFGRMVAHNVTMTIAYRAAFFALMISSVIQPVVSLLVMLTIEGQGANLPFDRSQLVTYYLLLSFVSICTGCWVGEYLASGIRDGELSDTLVRPVPYIYNFVTNNLGEKIVKLPLLLPILVVVSLLFRSELSLPSDPLRWIGFAIAVVFAAATAFLLDFALGSLAFWIKDVSGLFRIKDLLRGLLAGQFVPLALFPPAFGPFLEMQPFRYTLSFPLEILASDLDSAALARGFAWQIGYCVLLWLSYRIIWHFGLKSYEAVGR